MSPEESPPPPQLSEQLGSLVSKPLLDLLNQAYPLAGALPTMTDTDRKIGFKLGQRAVVDFLLRCFEDATQQKVLR